MKKILIFSLAYYPRHVSGAEIAIKEITDRIDDIEFHMVTLRFSPSDAREEKIGNVQIHRVGSFSYFSKMFFPIAAATKARALHRSLRFDALWAMMTYMLLPVVTAKFLGVRVPHILTLQDGDPYEKVFGRLRILPFLPLLDYGFRTVALVQTISTYLREWPARRGYRGEVILIPNGASAESSLQYPQGEVDALKHTLGKQDDHVFLLSIGRLVHQKAIDDIIRALPLLPRQVRLLAVGDGPDLPMLKQLVRKLGVEARVIFAGYTTDRNLTAKYRRISDIFVLPSRSEGQGISFMSSMASGLPIIATQEGGIADFLFDAKRNPEKPTTGWAVDKNSPAQIAEAVEDILAHPEKVKIAVDNAKRLVEQDYNWDTIARDMRQKVFDRVI